MGKAAGGITFMIMSRVLSTVKLWMKHTAFKKEKRKNPEGSQYNLSQDDVMTSAEALTLPFEEVSPSRAAEQRR